MTSGCEADYFIGKCMNSFDLVYVVKSEKEEEGKKHVELTPHYDGIGPVNKDGVPIGLRTVSKGEPVTH